MLLALMEVMVSLDGRSAFVAHLAFDVLAVFAGSAVRATLHGSYFRSGVGIRSSAAL